MDFINVNGRKGIPSDAPLLLAAFLLRKKKSLWEVKLLPTVEISEKFYLNLKKQKEKEHDYDDD